MKILILTFTFIFSLNSSASDLEIVLGVLRQTTAEQESTGNKTATRPGFGFGVRTQYSFNENWAMTAGLFVEQRSTTDVILGVEHNPVAQYLDFPFQGKYNFNESVYIFAGASFWTLMSEDCGPTSGPCLIAEGPVKFVVPVHAGVGYDFTESLGVEIFYEYLQQEFWKNAFKDLTSTGVNLKYVF